MARLPGETEVSYLTCRTQPPSWSVATSSGTASGVAWDWRCIAATSRASEGRSVTLREKIFTPPMPRSRIHAWISGDGTVPT